MILVFFKGRGEWFVRDADSFKLAITRFTIQPYKDCNNYDLENDLCPDYHEWLSGDEDTVENFSEWIGIYESSKEKPSHYNFQPKDNDYNSHLKGIFARDPNIKGDIYNTDGLRSFGADYLECSPIQGVFKLNEEDEEAFRLTNDWNEVKKGVKTLLPCFHSKSAFTKKVSKGELESNKFEQYFFEIQYKRFFDFWGKTKPEKQKFTIALIDTENLEIVEKTREIISKEIPVHTNESTYQNIIAAYLDYIEGKLVGIEEHPSFTNKIKFTKQIDSYHEDGNDLPDRCFYDFSVIEKPTDANVKQKNISRNKEDTYLTFIGILFAYISGNIPGINKHPSFSTQGDLNIVIDRIFYGFTGLSESTLSHKLPLAKKKVKHLFS